MADRPAAGEVRLPAGRQVFRQIAQGAAQAFLEHRVIEGHGEHVGGRQLALDRQSQQMGEMFGGGDAHFGAEQRAGLAIAVKAHQAGDRRRHAGARLAGEIIFANGAAGVGNLREAGADPRDLRRGKHNAERRAAAMAHRRDIGGGVAPRYMALVGGFMHQGPKQVGVARQKDRGVAKAQGGRVDFGHAA